MRKLTVTVLLCSVLLGCAGGGGAPDPVDESAELFGQAVAANQAGQLGKAKAFWKTSYRGLPQLQVQTKRKRCSARFVLRARPRRWRPSGMSSKPRLISSASTRGTRSRLGNWFRN